MKEIIELENLVIGGDLESLEFAFREGYPIFYEELDAPLFLERTKEGVLKKDIMHNYAFILSLAGLNLSSRLNYEYRISKKTLTITGVTAWIKEYKFQNLFDFRNKFSQSETYKVVDYINIRSCGHHDLREIKIKDDTIKEVIFYPSLRNNLSKNFDIFRQSYETITKDAIVISHLKGRDIEKEENSHIYTRLRLKEIMKEAGIRGKKCGFYDNGKQKYNPIKLEFEKREILKIEKNERNYFYSKSKNYYMNKMYKYFYGRSTKTKED